MMYLATALYIMILPGHLTIASNCVDSDITAKTLSAADASKVYGYGQSGSSIDYTGGAGWAFFYDVTNSDCRLKSCDLRRASGWSFVVDHEIQITVTSNELVVALKLDQESSNNIKTRCKFESIASGASTGHMFSNLFDAEVQCGICTSDNVVVTSTITANSQSFPITGATPYFSFTKFAALDDQNCCAITSYLAYSDAGMTTAHTDLTVAVSSGTVTLTLPVAQANTPQTVTFYLQVNINSGLYYVPIAVSTNPVFTLVMTCLPSSSTITTTNSYATASLGNDQYVPVNVASSAYFELPTYTITLPCGGSLTSLQASTLSPSFNTFPALNDAVETSTGSGVYKIVPTDFSTSQRYQFWIFATLTPWTGSSRVNAQQYQLFVGCNPTYVSSITWTDNCITSVTGNVVDENDGPYTYTFAGPTPNPSSCLVTANSLGTATSGVLMDGSCTAPCTQIKITPSLVKTTQTFIINSIDADSNAHASPLITWNAAVCAVTSTTISNPSTLTSLTMSQEIDLAGSITGLIFKFDTFPVTQSLCDVASYIVYDTSGSTVHTQLETTTASCTGTICVRVKAGLEQIAASYQFKLQVAAEGGKTHLAYVTSVSADVFTLDIICGSGSTTVGESSYTSAANTDTQYVEKNSVSLTKFVAPQFTTSVSACALNLYKVTSHASSIVTGSAPWVQDPSIDGSEYVVIPTNINWDDEYLFYIYVEAQGLSQHYTVTQKRLIVGCTSSSVSFSHTSTDLTAYVRDATAGIYSFSLPSIPRSYCTVAKTEINDIKVDGLSKSNSMMFDPLCVAPCLSIKVDSTQVKQVWTFKILFTVDSTQTITYQTPTITLTLDCNAASTDISYSVSASNYTFFKNSASNTFSLNEFVCSNPSCCSAGLTYSLLTSGTDKTQTYSDLPALTKSGGNISTTVPVTDQGVFQFYIYAVNAYGSEVFTTKITINVAFDCINDDSIVLSAVKPSNDLVKSLDPTLASFSLIDQKYRIKFQGNINEVSDYSIDLTSRFEKTSSDDWKGCPITNYRIDKVMDGSKNIEVASYSSLFSISSRGIFKIDEYAEAYDRYQIYISAYNSGKWSNYETQGWLIEISFVNKVQTFPGVPVKPFFYDLPEKVSLETAELIKSENRTTNTVVLKIPQIVDLNLNDTHTLKVENLESFMTYSKESGEITFDQSKISQDEEGTYQLKVVITDNTNLRTIYYIDVDVKGFEPQEQKEDDDDAENPDTPPTSVNETENQKNEGNNGTLQKNEDDLRLGSKCKAKIVSINQFGRMKIEFKIDSSHLDADIKGRNLQSKKFNNFVSQNFNASMKSNYSGDNIPIYTLLNSSVIDMYIDPAMYRDQREGFNLSSVNFTWQSMSFENDTWEIQLNFSSPQLISTEREYDRMVIHVRENGTQYFYSDYLNKYLDPSYQTIDAKIQRQMPHDAQNIEGKSKEAAAALLAVFVLLSMTDFLKIFRTAPLILHYIRTLIRTLQIIVHLPILLTVLPSNAMMVFKQIIPITKYDFGVGIEGWMTFDENKEEQAELLIHDQMRALGYPTMNAVQNLDTLTIFFLAYVLILLLLLALVLCIRRKERIRREAYSEEQDWITQEKDTKRLEKMVKVKDWLTKKMIWTEVIGILVEAFLIFAIAGFMQIQLSEVTTNGEYFGVAFGFFSILVVYALPGVFIIFLLNKPLYSIDKKYEVTWGRLHKGVRIGNRWNLAYWFVFVIRRLAMVLICFCVPYGGLQVMMMLYMNFAVLIYLGNIMPLDTPDKNKLDLINECFIANATYHMLIFTDWTIDQQTKYNFGWSMILNLVACYIVNLIFTFRVVFMQCQSYFRIYQKNFTSVCDLMQYVKENLMIKWKRYKASQVGTNLLVTKIKPAPAQVVLIEDNKIDLSNLRNHEKVDQRVPVDEENKVVKVKRTIIQKQVNQRTVKNSNSSVLLERKSKPMYPRGQSEMRIIDEEFKEESKDDNSIQSLEHRIDKQKNEEVPIRKSITKEEISPTPEFKNLDESQQMTNNLEKEMLTSKNMPPEETKQTIHKSNMSFNPIYPMLQSDHCTPQAQQFTDDQVKFNFEQAFIEDKEQRDFGVLEEWIMQDDSFHQDLEEQYRRDKEKNKRNINKGYRRETNSSVNRSIKPQKHTPKTRTSKQLGNDEFKKGNYATAIAYYTQAISENPNDHTLYSSRAACYNNLKNYEKALEDANRCISMDADSAKGHYNKGLALHGMQKYREAMGAYGIGIDRDPQNMQIKAALQQVILDKKKSEQATISKNSQGSKGRPILMFNVPEAEAKLKSNPKIAKYFEDPSFNSKWLVCKQDQEKMMQLIQTDPRFMDVFKELTGVDILDMQAKEKEKEIKNRDSLLASRVSRNAPAIMKPKLSGAQKSDQASIQKAISILFNPKPQNAKYDSKPNISIRAKQSIQKQPFEDDSKPKIVPKKTKKGDLKITPNIESYKDFKKKLFKSKSPVRTPKYESAEGSRQTTPRVKSTPRTHAKSRDKSPNNKSKTNSKQSSPFPEMVSMDLDKIHNDLLDNVMTKLSAEQAAEFKKAYKKTETIHGVVSKEQLKSLLKQLGQEFTAEVVDEMIEDIEEAEPLKKLPNKNANEKSNVNFNKEHTPRIKLVDQQKVDDKNEEVQKLQDQLKKVQQKIALAQANQQKEDREKMKQELLTSLAKDQKKIVDMEPREFKVFIATKKESMKKLSKDPHKQITGDFTEQEYQLDSFTTAALNHKIATTKIQENEYLRSNSQEIKLRGGKKSKSKKERDWDYTEPEEKYFDPNL